MKVINMQIHKKFQKFNTCYHSRDRRRERNIVWPSDTAHTSPLTVFPPSIGKEGNPIASSLEGMVTPCHLLLLRLTQPGMMPPWALATPLVLYRVPCSLPLSIPLKNSLTRNISLGIARDNSCMPPMNSPMWLLPSSSPRPQSIPTVQARCCQLLPGFHFPGLMMFSSNCEKDAQLPTLCHTVKMSRMIPFS